MTKVTRIKAKDEPTKSKKPTRKIARTEKTAEKTVIKEKVVKPKKNEKKVFILFRPFVALFKYLRDSWREIRQVRWPNHKATWKMVFAVFIYTVMFIILISLLDLFFTWLFSLIIK